MIGAICGDIIGSVHEGAGTKTKNFPLFAKDCRFTDDTVLTVAVAARLLHGGAYIDLFHHYFHAYPHAGYGGSFIEWAGQRRREPYQSWGNGAAMRVSPVGIACNTLNEVLAEARRSAEVTHDHPEGIRGARATAAAVFLARTGARKPDIQAYLEREFGYAVSERLADIRDGYRFDISCQGSVPQSVIAFLESDSYEDAIRNAISLGGDADTMAAIAGGIAEAFYGGVPEPLRIRALEFLDQPLRAVVDAFMERFGDRVTGHGMMVRHPVAHGEPPR
jgi:ADP-ribosylglycohydrolase